MKFERTIAFSYLRHIKKCQVIQSDYVPCITKWNIQNKRTDELIKMAKNYFRNKYRINIMEDINNLKDLEIHSKIDALGIKFNDDYSQQVYGVNTSFNKELKQVKIENILDSVFITASYFISCLGRNDGTIIYLCPYISYEYIKKLSLYYSDIKELFMQLNCNFDISILLNDQFKNEVINQLNGISDDVNFCECEKYMNFIKFQKIIDSGEEYYKNKEIDNSKEENKKHESNKEFGNVENTLLKNEIQQKISLLNKQEETDNLDMNNVFVNNAKLNTEIEISAFKNENEEIKPEITAKKIYEPETEKQKKSLDVVLNEDTNSLLFDSITNEDKNDIETAENLNNNHTTSYYMNKHNVKTQFSVDSGSINKIIEERNKRLVKELLESKSTRKMNEKFEDLKISELIKIEFNRLFEEQKLPRGEVKKLQELEYSNKTFGINYPVLRKVNINYSLEEQRRDRKGNAIYYGFISSIYGEDFYICSEWSESNRINFLRYLSFYK